MSKIKIILEKNEELDDVKEMLAKAFIHTHKNPHDRQFQDPSLEELYKKTNKKFEDMIDRLLFSIESYIKSTQNTSGIVEKSLKGKTPTFSGHKLHKKIKFQGMDISIENRKGSFRYWKDRNSEEGRTLMHSDYGYIKRTLGADKDHIDCYVGPNKESEKVFIVHQAVVNDWKKFDEDKCMLGFDNKEDAKKAYLKQYSDPRFLMSIDEIAIDEFKEKVIGKEIKGKIK